jgi:hypothetical protein
MRQKRILIPTQSTDVWKRLLAEPNKHWKPGYSAMLMAETWENASGLPSEIAPVFHASKDGYFKDLQLALAVLLVALAFIDEMRMTMGIDHSVVLINGYN